MLASLRVESGLRGVQRGGQCRDPGERRQGAPLCGHERGGGRGAASIGPVGGISLKSSVGAVGPG